MNNKERLEKAQRIDVEIRSNITALTLWMDMAKKLDDVSENVLLNNNCVDNMMTPTLTKLYGLQLEASQRIEQLMWEKDEVIAAINAIDNQTYRIILVNRYLNGKTWSEIADELNYDLRHIYRLHNEALREIHFPDEVA